MATPTLFEIQCALMSGVADHASRKNQQINMYPVPAGWLKPEDSYQRAPEQIWGHHTSILKINDRSNRELETRNRKQTWLV